ncbi:MAG: N-acetylmuramoyl-L-alanine amidase [Candidatus Sumerlaeaceae bacterium]
MKKLIATLFVSSFAISAYAATPDLPSCDEWRLACSSNYTNASRPGSNPINYVVIHKVQGSAASAASWFQNCSASVSAHFTFNNSSGYCYQSVYEADIGWHAGNWTYNQQSVGIEHGGYVSSNDTATVCYDESALETKSCIIYYTVRYDRAHILGHSEVPGATHTDPGQYWNWSYYMSKCNPTPSSAGTTVVDNSSGGFSASTGWATGSSAADKYGADYRYHSTAAASDPANWTANLTGGTYDISAWWSAGTNRSTTAPYILPNGATVSKNQQANGGTWNLLGTIGLAGGNNTTKLSIWTTTGYVVVADAVKYYGPK